MPTPGFEHGGSDLWSNTLPLDHGGAQASMVKFGQSTLDCVIKS